MASGLRDALRGELAPELLLTYVPLAKQVPEWDGYAYPGMVVVGQFLEWKEQRAKRPAG